MKILCTFSHTRFRELQDEWLRARVGLAAFTGPGTLRRESPREPGKIVLFSFPSGRILRAASHPRAAGFVQEEDRILLCSGAELRILDPITFRMRRSVSHRNFNTLRSISKAVSGGYWLADAGVDTVFRLDPVLRVVGAWNATQHGYPRTPLGKLRRVSFRVDHRKKIYPTLGQTTHLNSAIPKVNGRGILVSLFHPGEVVSVSAGRRPRVVVRGLKGPHAIRSLRSGGYWVCDSMNNRILRFSPRRPILDLKATTDWLQDACELPNGHLLLADAGNHRLVEFDPASSRTRSHMTYSHQWKIFQIEIFRG